MLAPRRLAISLVRNRLSRPHTMATMSGPVSDSKPTSEGGPVESAIRAKLTELFKPSQLDITNDSWQHRHHAAMRAQGGDNGETHFSISVVSEEFLGKNTMQRHRMIYSALSDELAAGLHALSLKTKTPVEAQGNKQA
ncbi:bola-like protein [Lenzites betulinus]|nr:bola-like protein [Lenzites betulinus]